MAFSITSSTVRNRTAQDGTNLLLHDAVALRRIQNNVGRHQKLSGNEQAFWNISAPSLPDLM
ncbi:MAG: hypothetical protein IPN95_31040 [Bacteroidetes bacterium]|nr:hypothetical protein [Bacteroidota bacterium]